MIDKPSRSVKREEQFYLLAGKGCFEYKFSLFKSEAIKLIKQGFSVIRFGDNKKNSLPSTISCKNAFKNGIPPVVSSYIDGKNDFFPHVANWAQELYVIAARANNEKAQNNNE